MSDYETLLTEWFGPEVGETERPTGHARWFRGGASSLLFGGKLEEGRTRGRERERPDK